MSTSSWPELFSNPRFRKGWHDHRSDIAPTEDERDSVVYLFGRLMSVEAAPSGLLLPLPSPFGILTEQMITVIRACPAFEAQMVAAQWLRAHGDPVGMTQPLGVKQGDER